MNGKNVKLRDAKARKWSIDFKGEVSMTKQSFRDGTRVDQILKKYATLGVDGNDVGLFQRNMAREPFGLDIGRDYQAQLNKVIAIKEYFGRLPSRVRDFFQHEPANMLEFMANPKNKERCVEFGLFPAAPEGSARKPEKAAGDVEKGAEPRKGVQESTKAG